MVYLYKFIFPMMPLLQNLSQHLGCVWRGPFVHMPPLLILGSTLYGYPVWGILRHTVQGISQGDIGGPAPYQYFQHSRVYVPTTLVL